MLIGHLTDLHLDGGDERGERLARGLAAARVWGVDHLVLTGDLTARGDDASLEQLGDILRRSGLSDRSTVVPGNHDRVPERWAATLGRVPALRSLLLTSSAENVHLLQQGRGITAQRMGVLALDTRQQGPAPLALRARGRVGDSQLARLRKVGGILGANGVPLVVAMHHGPQRSPMHLVDGLADAPEVLDALRECPTATVLCGHDHRALDMWPRQDGSCRIFCAPAVVDSDWPLRVYETRGAALVPVNRGSAGQYLRLET